MVNEKFVLEEDLFIWQNGVNHSVKIGDTGLLSIVNSSDEVIRTVQLKPLSVPVLKDDGKDEKESRPIPTFASIMSVGGILVAAVFFIKKRNRV